MRLVRPAGVPLPVLDAGLESLSRNIPADDAHRENAVVATKTHEPFGSWIWFVWFVWLRPSGRDECLGREGHSLSSSASSAARASRMQRRMVATDFHGPS